MGGALIPVIAVAPSGLNYFSWFCSQGSQSLALSLALIAAPQLVSFEAEPLSLRDSEHPGQARVGTQ